MTASAISTSFGSVVCKLDLSSKAGRRWKYLTRYMAEETPSLADLAQTAAVLAERGSNGPRPKTFVIHCQSSPGWTWIRSRLPRLRTAKRVNPEA